MRTLALTPLLAALSLAAQAELKLPAIIGDNMVLQQKQVNPIWGWDTPGTAITVTFAGQTKTAKAGTDGKWTVKLDAVPANAKPATLGIKGTSSQDLKNVLVGAGLWPEPYDHPDTWSGFGNATRKHCGNATSPVNANGRSPG